MKIRIKFARLCVGIFVATFVTAAYFSTDQFDACMTLMETSYPEGMIDKSNKTNLLSCSLFEAHVHEGIMSFDLVYLLLGISISALSIGAMLLKHNPRSIKLQRKSLLIFIASSVTGLLLPYLPFLIGKEALISVIWVTSGYLTVLTFRNPSISSVSVSKVCKEISNQN